MVKMAYPAPPDKTAQLVFLDPLGRWVPKDMSDLMASMVLQEEVEHEEKTVNRAIKVQRELMVYLENLV